MKRAIIITFLYLINSTFSLCQQYALNLDHLFLWQQVNARTEAMGRGGAASFGSPYSAFLNPASSSFSEGINTEISHLEPLFYIDDKAIFNSYGISFNTKKYGAITLNALHFNSKREYSTVLPSSSLDTPYPIREFFTPAADYFMINYSYLLPSNLSIGININYLKINGARLKFDSFLFDAGLMQKFSVNGVNGINNYYAGMSLTNIGVSKAEYSISDKYYRLYNISLLIPSIFRIGGAYEYLPMKKIGDFSLFKMLLSLNYKDVLNSKYNSAIQAGSEFTFLDILKIRAGYYYEEYDDNQPPVYIDKVSKFTYGFGVNIPIGLLYNSNYPIEIQFDYANPVNPQIQKENYIFLFSNTMYDEYMWNRDSGSTIYTLNIKLIL